MSSLPMTPRIIACLASVAIALAGFVVYPGCATTGGSPQTAGDVQHDYFETAMRTLEKKKRRGQLPGIEPTAVGTFSGTWRWYDRRDPTAQRQIRVVFKYADGRPDRKFDLVSAGFGWPPAWQPVPITRE